MMLSLSILWHGMILLMKLLASCDKIEIEWIILCPITVIRLIPQSVETINGDPLMSDYIHIVLINKTLDIGGMKDVKRRDIQGGTTVS